MNASIKNHHIIIARLSLYFGKYKQKTFVEKETCSSLQCNKI